MLTHENSAFGRDMQNQINELYTNFEEKFVQVVDANAAMAKADQNLGHRISEVEKIVLELEQNQKLLKKSTENNFSEKIDEVDKKVTNLNTKITEKIEELETQLAEIRQDLTNDNCKNSKC